MYEYVYNEYLNKNKEINTGIILIDSTFIPNKSVKVKNGFVDRNSYYNNKFGAKLTAITNEYGLPIYISVDSGSKSDVKIAEEMITKHVINNKQLLADAGYDSNEFKNQLESNNCTYLIPENKRKKYDVNIKETLDSEIKKIIIDTNNEKKIIWLVYEKTEFFHKLSLKI